MGIYPLGRELDMAPFVTKQRSCRPFNGSTYFKPRNISLTSLEINILELDELEAIHLCDHEDLSQTEAAEKMKISTSTLQRLLYSGRKKIADALYSSKAIEILKPKQVTELSQAKGGFRNRCRKGNQTTNKLERKK